MIRIRISWNRNRTIQSRYLAIAIALGIAIGTASCFDPQHNDAVSALGPEAPGVRTGPNHRPGQPCSVCHGGLGPGPDFAVAGTAYERRDGTSPLVQAEIVFTDRTQDPKVCNSGVSAPGCTTLITNEAGNFYIASNRYEPAYPIDVAIKSGGLLKQMFTPIEREGGCSVCHLGKGDAQHARAVYLKEPTDP